jgi:hypothetical protein
MKYLIVALFLAVPLTMGARVVKARRINILLSCAISFAALMAGHFALPGRYDSWQIIFVPLAALITLVLGIRYLLVTTARAALAIAMTILVILLAGLLVLTEF